MATVKQLLDIARAELRTKESPAGSNNVKYNTEYYGREVYDGLWGTTFPWCVVFVWWCCKKAGVQLPIKTASCGTLMAYAKTCQMWVTSGFKPGDIVIYDWNGDMRPDHCGIIEAVGGSSIIAIEGNTAIGNDSDGGEVMRRTRMPWQVLGAVRPKYEEDDMDIDALTDGQLIRLAERMQAALGKRQLGKALAPEMREAVVAGITDGSNPNAFCTRAQAAIMVHRGTKK